MALATLTSADAVAQNAPEVPPTAAVAPAAATTPTEFSIAAGSLADALHQFSEQSGIQVFFESELVNGKAAPEINGSLQARDALNALLAGSGLVHQFVNDKTLILRRSPDAAIEGEGAAIAGAVTPLAAEALADADDITTESVTSIRRGGIEEVIITARRREESVQNVPIAITALTSEDMKAFGIKNVGDMEGIVPGLNMGGGGNGLKKDSNPFIRGVGQRETKVTLDPGVGSYIDGIYLARTGGALLDTVGMERVEVLRGPQGTLFGRNAVGGSISFTTIKPKPGLDGSVTVNVGNYGRSDVMAVANIPLIGNELLSRFTISSKNSDGYFTNVMDGEKWGDDNRITGIGQFRWLPSEDLTFDLLTERTRVRETPRPAKCKLVRPMAAATSSIGRPYVVGDILRDENGVILRDEFGGILRGPRKPNPTYDPYYFRPSPVVSTDGNRLNNGNPSNRKSFQQLCAEAEALPTNQFASDFAELPDVDGNDLLDKGRYWIDTSTVGLTGTWDIGDLGVLENTQFKSISAWRKVEQIADEDLDAVGMAQLLRVQDGFNESWQGSQELQFTGAAMDGRLFFSTGLYYFKEETPQDILIRSAGVGMSPPRASDGRYTYQAMEPTRETLETDNQAYAWFGQLDFNLTQQLQLTLGLRFTHEERWSAYTKAYTVGPSMIVGDVFRNPDGTISTGIDYAQTIGFTDQPGLTRVQDWVFYSAEYLGVDRDDPSFRADCPSDQVFICYFNDLVPGYEVGSSRPLGTAYGREDASTSDQAWTPMASLKYHADGPLLEMLSLDSAMAYVTYSEGFGAGGVTAGAVDLSSSSGYLRIEDPIIFKPQHVKNYELGLKLQGLDRRLQANMAVFYTDYKDMQITSTATRGGIPIPYIDNVGKSVIQGFEGEFVVLPLEDWRVVLNASYTHADMKEWNARVIALDPITGVPVLDAYTTITRDDEPMPRVPKWQAYAMTDYTIRLVGGSVLVPSVAVRYTSEIYHGFDRGSYCFTTPGCNISLQVENPIGYVPQVPDVQSSVLSDKVVFVDARISWISGDGKMEMAAWGKNLTNKDDYLVGAIPLVDTTGTVGQIFADPRTFGLTMTYNFGAQ